jgi:hypothetical protein
LKIKPELLAGDLSKVDYGPIIAGIKKEATDEVTARVKGILEVCALGGKEKLAIGLISSNATIEDARKKVLEAKQTDSNQHQIQSSVGALGTGEVSPLILDAQKRAKAVEKK